MVPSGIIAILLCSQYTRLCVHKKEFIQYCIFFKVISLIETHIPFLDRSKGASGSLKLFFVCMCFCCAHRMCAHEWRQKKSISGVVPQDSLFLFMCICMCTCKRVPTQVKKGFGFYGTGVIEAVGLSMWCQKLNSGLIVSMHKHQGTGNQTQGLGLTWQELN